MEQRLPALSRTALLLDLDGTLLDIAPTPDSVVVPDGFLPVLAALRDRLDGALAVISGRPVAQVDSLLCGIPTAVAGEHGGALRPAPAAPLERLDLPTAPPAWYAAAERMAAAHPGALLERKARGFVLHYRLAPTAGPALHDALATLVAPGEKNFLLMPAHMAWEIRPRGADKGSAVRRLMERAPFAARLPVFIGDDVTDEDAITAAQALGGVGLRVPETFFDPPGLRAWLAEAACRTADSWPPFRRSGPRGN